MGIHPVTEFNVILPLAVLTMLLQHVSIFKWVVEDVQSMCHNAQRLFEVFIY